MTDRPRLDSWKEIAGYLKLARVFAYPEELDQWLAHPPTGAEEAGEAAPEHARGDDARLGVESAADRPDAGSCAPVSA